VTQTKHHWWWKANQVFDVLKSTKTFNGSVVFLEEDHLLAPDVLHILRLMEQKKNLIAEKVDLITLGVHQKFITKNFDYLKSSAQVTVDQWVSSHHNMGFSITRQVWKEIMACKNHFCTYDDYNWDWSLHHVSVACLQKPLRVLTTLAPRVFHIGDCGLHNNREKTGCQEASKESWKILENTKSALFPKRLELLRARSKKLFKLGVGNGGWGDLRDHQLCLNISHHR